jgi:hypothetical protein
VPQRYAGTTPKWLTSFIRESSAVLRAEFGRQIEGPVEVWRGPGPWGYEDVAFAWEFRDHER